MNEDAYFARVLPIVGDRLAGKRVAVLHPIAAEVAQLLAANRVSHWQLALPHAPALAAELTARFGQQDVQVGDELAGVDLLMGGGNLTACWQLARACSEANAAGLAMLLLDEGAALLSLSPDAAYAQLGAAIASLGLTEANVLADVPPARAFDYLDLSHHAARVGRELLLGERKSGQIWRIGAGGWPWRMQIADCGLQIGVKGGGLGGINHAPTNPAGSDKTKLKTQNSKLKTVLLGCGSLGSYVARDMLLGGGVGQMVLLDDERVAAANPARQFYTRAEVGGYKVSRLAANLRGLGTDCRIVAHRFRLRDTRSSLARWGRLVEESRPDVVVLTTGTHADYLAARVLWQMKIPHIVARCYPRARYFEVVAVEGGRGPCYDCVRGHLYTGPTPSLTPEQRAAYDREPLAGELSREPATLIESGWAAAVAARIASQLARPAAEREGWFQGCIAEGATCFIGGNVAEMRPNGWAYGISRAGQVVAYGVADIIGSACATARPCPTCGHVYPAGRVILDFGLGIKHPKSKIP